jgi:hypothetical protein
MRDLLPTPQGRRGSYEGSTSTRRIDVLGPGFASLERPSPSYDRGLRSSQTKATPNDIPLFEPSFQDGGSRRLSHQHYTNRGCLDTWIGSCFKEPIRLSFCSIRFFVGLIVPVVPLISFTLDWAGSSVPDSPLHSRFTYGMQVDVGDVSRMCVFGIPMGTNVSSLS